ncbi:hypothetical protein F2Q70_00037722 [Brassica cretica]|uniref:Uncharacterized protein n=1 Tax=Brassica cretica TaxID=69181 RepID=A0A8S9JZM2_BRACR|nr:hypothetical protein F2Q70_00037722 [Brassica cretica]
MTNGKIRTGVDGAEGASASRRQTQVTERETSPRHPHNDRALAPETEPPWTVLFQSSSKAAIIGDETEAKFVIFTGGWRGPDDRSTFSLAHRSYGR